MVIARSRTRTAGKKTNPFVMLGLLAAVAGVGMVGLAAWHYFTQRQARAYQLKLCRGITLVNELTPTACKYFYSAKKEAPTQEDWKPFRDCKARDGDIFDAMITESVGAEDRVADAAFYRDGKGADGSVMRWGLQAHNYRYYGQVGPGREPDCHRTQVQVVPGYVELGGVKKSALFFRRPILEKPDKTDTEYGKAVVILLADVPSPEPSAAPTAVPAPAPQPPGPPTPAPAAPAPEPKGTAPAPAEKPAAESGPK